jgi:hypothetical protein
MGPRTVARSVQTAPPVVWTSEAADHREAVTKRALILVAIVSLVAAAGCGAVWGATIAGVGFLAIWLARALAASQ